VRAHVFLSNAGDVLGPLMVEADRRWGPISLSAAAWHPSVEAEFRGLPLRVDRVIPLWTLIEQAHQDATAGKYVSGGALASAMGQLSSDHGAWELIAADWRFVSRWKKERAAITLMALITEVSRVFNELQPDVLVMDAVADMAGFVHLLAARSRGIAVASFGGARLPGRFTISSDEFERPQKLAGFLDQGPPSWSVEAAAALLETYEAREVRALTHLDSPLYSARPGIAAADIREFLNHVRLSRGVRSDYVMYGGPLTAVASRLKRIARSRSQQKLLGTRASNVDGSYALYCLHFEPEAATHVKGMYHRDQATLIEQIALSLPSDLKLIVKEHPVSVGRRPTSFYQRLASNPNVVLAASGEDSLTLAANASVVFALTGTIGFESYLLGKPVVVFGNCVYDVFPGVTKLGSPTDFRFDDLVTPSKPERMRTLAAYLASTYPGLFAPGWFLPPAKTAENLGLLADGLGRWFADQGLVPASDAPSDIVTRP
jgi:hypothetical protein